MLKTLKQDASEALRKSLQWRKLWAVDPTMPSNHYHKMADSLSHKHASHLIQLHTSHAPLNKHLYNMKFKNKKYKIKLQLTKSYGGQWAGIRQAMIG